MSLKDLQIEIHELSASKGWWEDTTYKIIPEKLALIHSEISEALEEYRIGLVQGVYYDDNGKPEGLGIELADAVIRILDLAEFIGLDIEELLKEKHNYNKTRPWKHGGKLA